jgi:hypothetical protein
MDININLNVNSEPLVEMAQRANEANSNAQNLNNTLKDKAPEAQIIKKGNALGKTGKAMTGLKQAVSGFGKIAGAELGDATGIVGTLGKSFTGLGRVIPFVTTAFRTLGTSLMTNPIFLIGTIVAALVVGIGLLLNKLGLLQPIFDAIGTVIQDVVDGFRSMTDWLGLTTKEMEKGEDAALAYEAALKKIKAQQQLYGGVLQRDLDVARAQGATLEDLAEKEKGLTNLKILGAQQTEKASKNLAIEKRKELYALQLGSDKYESVLKAMEDAEQAVIDAQEEQKNLKNELIIIDINLGKEQIERSKKQADMTKINAEKEIELVKKNEKLKVLLARDNAWMKADAQIKAEDEIFNAIKARQQALQLSELDIKVLEQEKLVRQEEFRKSIEKTGESVKSVWNEEKKIFEVVRQEAEKAVTQVPDNSEYIEMNRKTILANKQFQIDSIKEVLDFENLNYSERISNIEAYYAAKNSLLEAQRQIELSAVEEDSKEAAIINQKYDALIKENKKKNSEDIRDINKDIMDASFELGKAGLTGLEAMSDIFFQNKLKAAKGNAVEEEKIAKQQFKVNKAFQIGQAVMNGLQSILAITSTAVDPTGVTTGLRVAAQVALNVATIAKIAATQFQGGASNAGGSQGASTPAISVPTTPSFNLFGQGNQMNVSSAQPTTTVSDPQGNILSVIAQVSETEISAVQARNRRYSNSAEL